MISRARIAACYLLQADSLTTRELVERMVEHGVFSSAEPYSPERDRQLRKTGATLRKMESLGLVVRGVPARGSTRVVDRKGLCRVLAVGLAQYARERQQILAAREAQHR